MIRNSKILIIALPLTLILLCYAAYEYGYTALMTKTAELQDTRELKEKMLFKYIAAISKKQQIASTLHFLRPVKVMNDEGFIKEPASAAAMERLRGTLKEIIVQGGGQITGDRSTEPVKSGIYMIYEIEVDSKLPDTRALNEIVYAIESHKLHMVIKNLDIRVTNPNAPREMVARIKVAAIGTVGR